MAINLAAVERRQTCLPSSASRYAAPPSELNWAFLMQAQAHGSGHFRATDLIRPKSFRSSLPTYCRNANYLLPVLAGVQLQFSRCRPKRRRAPDVSSCFALQLLSAAVRRRLISAIRFARATNFVNTRTHDDTWSASRQLVGQPANVPPRCRCDDTNRHARAAADCSSACGIRRLSVSGTPEQSPTFSSFSLAADATGRAANPNGTLRRNTWDIWNLTHLFRAIVR